MFETKNMQDYLACISSVDDNVGRVLNYLDESGLAKTTMVVYSSDQGFYLSEHGWFDKCFIYNESFKTPLLIRWQWFRTSILPKHFYYSQWFS